jgi:hypothetical protein
VDKRDEFIVGWELGGYRAIFEQDDATGYLYLANSEKILHALHIYSRKPALNVAEQDVEVIWTDSGDRCGVKIFGKLRGVIGINGDIYRPANVMDSDGIVEAKWWRGFGL